MGHDRPQRRALKPTIDSGQRCAKCGYNLTGLTKPRCPECGTAADFSKPDMPPVAFAVLAGLVFVVCVVVVGILTYINVAVSMLPIPDRRPSLFIVGFPRLLDFAIAGFVFVQVPAAAIGGFLGFTFLALAARQRPGIQVLRYAGMITMGAGIGLSVLFILFRVLSS